MTLRSVTYSNSQDTYVNNSFSLSYQHSENEVVRKINSELYFLRALTLFYTNETSQNLQNGI
jgi:hypothetical protein